jgi:phage baseplate assembly protein W
VTAAGAAPHARDPIGLLVFTNTGERVMRPNLGSGVDAPAFAA